MRDLLIRYLLGELEPGELRRLEERLQTSPELRRELDHLRTCLTAEPDYDPAGDLLPCGLAERTARRVSELDGDDCAPRSCSSAIEPTALSALDPSPTALGWSLADLTVAGGVFLAVSMLVFPALRDSREATRAAICQDHQQQLWVALVEFAQGHAGFLPRIRPDENAGMFAMQLAEKGYLSAEQLAVLLVCPGGPLADKIRAGEFQVTIPTRAQLASMSPRELAEARRMMSPFYAYQFPFRRGNYYTYRQDDRQPLAPILCDASSGEPGEIMSPNHAGMVQVLCADGSVRQFQSCRVPAFDDDLYRNLNGVVAAGCSPYDAVLGRSEATPAGVEFVSRSR
jgi:hypothetical protein